MCRVQNHTMTRPECQWILQFYPPYRKQQREGGPLSLTMTRVMKALKAQTIRAYMVTVTVEMRRLSFGSLGPRTKNRTAHGARLAPGQGTPMCLGAKTVMKIFPYP